MASLDIKLPYCGLNNAEQKGPHRPKWELSQLLHFLHQTLHMFSHHPDNFSFLREPERPHPFPVTISLISSNRLSLHVDQTRKDSLISLNPSLFTWLPNHLYGF